MPKSRNTISSCELKYNIIAIIWMVKMGYKHMQCFHDLRHSCASVLLAQGVPMKQIQEWLGHSDMSTTANIYSHLDAVTKADTGAAMSKALG